MENCGLLVLQICLIVEVTCCFLHRKESETTRNYHVTGVSTALDNLVQKYEQEHQKFYEEVRDGDILLWHSLDFKNLSTYCKKYLQCTVPTRSTDSATGSKIMRTLNYGKENINITNEVVIVQCKVRNIQRILSYYMTMAPEPDCVYSLKCAAYKLGLIFSIINKYCNFEEKPLRVRRSLKRKRVEIANKRHHTTGEPIAKDEYLLQFELEHQKMVNQLGREGKYLEWANAMVHPNLNDYCYQYMSECVPGRYRDRVKGSWKSEKLLYGKLKTNQTTEITIVTCKPHDKMKRHYHITRAPEVNCVYALLRMGRNIRFPLVIIFKHCDFEDNTDHQTVSQHRGINDQNSFPKVEVVTIEAQQFFPTG